ncbi:c-type lectin domain-containing protein [Nephila pilipes]|uniref:C-type lectin domain-containing protein n=1 Tax=Nephila pilipes TaxID=299642 RepID=A0A8X6TST2_NEPPI|nr:c-type lectin domain-containing protein [Nephila pilipes]
MCVYLSSRVISLDSIDSYCSTEVYGAKAFTRRLTDEGLKDFQRILADYLVFPNYVYIGMQRQLDSMRRSTDTFAFSNGEGTVKADEYGLWASDPEYYDCGTVSYSKDFKVVPFQCDDKTIFMCEKKEEPCHHDYVRYVDYYGKCLVVIPDKENFMSAGYQCDNSKGHLFAYKSSDDTRSVASAVYSSVTLDGGIYAGLRKTSTGKWMYENEEEETSKSRWDPDDDRENDCGVYRFTRNQTLSLFSMKCDIQHRVLCIDVCRFSHASQADFNI